MLLAAEFPSQKLPPMGNHEDPALNIGASQNPSPWADAVSGGTGHMEEKRPDAAGTPPRLFEPGENGQHGTDRSSRRTRRSADSKDAPVHLDFVVGS